MYQHADHGYWIGLERFIRSKWHVLGTDRTVHVIQHCTRRIRLSFHDVSIVRVWTSMHTLLLQRNRIITRSSPFVMIFRYAVHIWPVVQYMSCRSETLNDFRSCYYKVFQHRLLLLHQLFSMSSPDQGSWRAQLINTVRHNCSLETILFIMDHHMARSKSKNIGRATDVFWHIFYTNYIM